MLWQRKRSTPSYFVRTPRPGKNILMAGLLTCGSTRPAPSRPGGPVVSAESSSLTVAGAVTDLVPFGYAAPCSLFIPDCLRRRENHLSLVWRSPAFLSRGFQLPALTGSAGLGVTTGKDLSQEPPTVFQPTLLGGAQQCGHALAVGCHVSLGQNAPPFL